MKTAKLAKKIIFKKLNKNVFLLACASLFSDIATEMLYPVLPIYLTQYLRVSGSTLGIIEGSAEAIQNSIQAISGYFSDKLMKRKPLAIIGYTLSALSRPFIGIATTWPGAWAARLTDRLGAGTRSAPRDALIAGSVSEENRGMAFGLEGFGDNLGAFIGPIITVGLFFILGISIHQVFYLSFIPGLLALLMVLFVKEHKGSGIHSKVSLRLIEFPNLYWRFICLTVVFGIGNSSNAFLIMQIKSHGLSLPVTIIIYAFYNLAAAIISYPAGTLSDKFGRKPLLVAALCIFVAAYAGFALSSSVVVMGVLFIMYGLFQGIFRSVGKAFAIDFVEPRKRASAIGWYGTATGLSNLTAGIVAGLLWDKVGHSAVFLYGAATALISIPGFILLLPNRSHI